MKPSPESKTDTTLSNLVLAAQTSIDNLSAKIAEDNPSAVLPDPLSKYLKKDDVLIEYKIVARTSDGELFNVEGISHLSKLLSESMLPEAPMNFENTFNSAIVRPSLNSFMQHIRSRVDEVRRSTTLSITSESTGFSSPSSEFLTD